MRIDIDCYGEICCELQHRQFFMVHNEFREPKSSIVLFCIAFECYEYAGKAQPQGMDGSGMKIEDRCFKGLCADQSVLTPCMLFYS